MAFAGASLAPVSASEIGARWERVAAPAGAERAEVVAFEDGRLAVGSARGVVLGPRDGRLERALTRGPVLDLEFLEGGGLLAATEAGLYRIDGPGRVTALRAGPGEGARRVVDLTRAGSTVAAATDAGVFVSDDGLVWRRAEGFPSGAASRVALSAAGDGVALYALIENELWRAPLRGASIASARRVVLPLAPEGEGPVDLAVTLPGEELVVVSARTLVRRDGSGIWRRERPVLPPGAIARRLVHARGLLWLATDSGLLVAHALAGPWRRAGPPAGHVGVRGLAASGSELVVATAHGLLRLAAAQGATRAVAPRAHGEPPVQLVHRRALRYAALEPERMRRLRRGAASRGWLPTLSFRVDYDRERDRHDDYDEAFLSGETRRLRDNDRDRSEDYGLSLVASWDLGELAFNPESIDVSREARLVAQLRDDVLDELTQIYFARQQLLAELAATPPGPEAVALQRRADELAAGLDAWTGGWFSAELARLRSGPASPASETSP